METNASTPCPLRGARPFLSARLLHWRGCPSEHDVLAALGSLAQTDAGNQAPLLFAFEPTGSASAPSLEFIEALARLLRSLAGTFASIHMIFEGEGIASSSWAAGFRAGASMAGRDVPVRLHASVRAALLELSDRDVQWITPDGLEG